MKKLIDFVRISRPLVLFAGFFAFLWLCLRTLPKPSRMAYPCQRAAAPLAAGFMLWAVGLLGSGAFLGRLRGLTRSRGLLAGGLFALLILGASFHGSLNAAKTSALAAPIEIVPNQPVGVARGAQPGRVVWSHHPGATNENITHVDGDYYHLDKNTDPDTVDAMVSEALRLLTGATTDAEAWQALFTSFNQEHLDRPQGGYVAGQQVAVKINLTTGAGLNRGQYAKGVTWVDSRPVPDTSPQIILALLRQLVEVAGVAETDIWLGDPNKPLYDQVYTSLKAAFPNVHYIDRWGLAGRTLAAHTAQDVLFYSDKNAPYQNLTTPKEQSDKLPQCFVDADYLINLCVLKSHETAGFSANAKNHFGSQCRQSGWNGDQGWAYHLHYSLPNDSQEPGFGMYRALVDLMGHKDLGGKTVLNILDGLWSTHHSVKERPNKWKSAPFNNDYPSSIFMSQDRVAIEAVGLDFLRTEYNSANYPDTSWDYPTRLVGIEDYLLQAADSVFWPKTTAGVPFAGYDPENDGTLIGSLGVFERWDGPATKRYSRNLDPVNGTGIELLKTGEGPNAVDLRSQVTAPSIAPGGAHRVDGRAMAVGGATPQGVYVKPGEKAGITVGAR